MRRRILFGGVLVVSVALLAGCSSEEPPERLKQTGHAILPADSSKPWALMSPDEREERRERLRKEGRYDCCIKPGCAECIGTSDSCGCSIAIKEKDPICGECLSGYKEGQGKFKLVSVVELEQIRNKAAAQDN